MPKETEVAMQDAKIEADAALLKKWGTLAAELRDAGFCVVAVVSKYAEDNSSAHFTTTLMTNDHETDHVIMDAIRDITCEWHNATHRSQLVFTEPAAETPAPEAATA